MSRVLVVELVIVDESGCPMGTKQEAFSATLNTSKSIWSIQREKPQEGEKKGEGASRQQAVANWIGKNIGTC